MKIDPSISVAIALILEKSLNQALQYDPATRLKLSALANKSVKITVSQPSIALTFCLLDDSIQVKTYSENDADVEISGTALDFLTAIEGSKHSMADSQLNISGKITVLNHLKEILSDIDIDWEEPLNEIFGVIPGHTLAESLKSSWHWLRQQTQGLQHGIPTYLSEELRAIPTQCELEHFYDEVDQLKSSATRLEAKLKRIQKKILPPLPDDKN